MFTNAREWQKYNHDAYKQLACAILFEAMDAWQKHGTITLQQTRAFLDKAHFSQAHRRCLLADELGFDSPRQEMLAFFRGTWFRGLCEMADVLPEMILRKLALD